MNKIKYNLDELLYMLEGDTTVMRGLLLENTAIKLALAETIKGKLNYGELVAVVYREF